ncbi:MAG: FAD-dependent oxidoreductase, partial [Pseudomonadota bacterium]
MAQAAIIVGAGVIGVASAYALARKGWRVTLIDEADGPAMGTSHANGAQLSYCFTDAQGSPATLASLPRLIAGKGGVSIELSARPEYLRWLAEFARNCTSHRFRTNTLAVLNLAERSRLAMDRLRDCHELDFEHHQAGKVNLIYSAKERAQAEKVMALKREGSCKQELLGRADLEGLDPALSGLDHGAIGGVSTPSEMVGNPLKFCHALLELLTKHYGVETRFKAGVSAIRDGGQTACLALDDGEELTADMAIVACGHDSNLLLRPLGHAVRVQPMKGYSFEMPLTVGSPRISLTDGKRRLVFTNLGDRMRVAGIAELGNGSREIDPGRIEWLRQAAQHCLPNGGDYSRASHFQAPLFPQPA